LDSKTLGEALGLLGIDNMGLSPSDRAVLETLIDKFSGGPVGLNTLSAALSEEEATIEEFIEPYLIQIGFLERTPRGRVTTERAHAHLGSTVKKSQDKLL
jgi:Holliday junction DNA helicase RuvB